MDIEILRLFNAAVEFGSLTAASKALGMSKQTVSRQITALESTLGVRLLNRTTRRLQLTDTGAAFYERSLRLVEDADEAVAEASAGSDHPQGQLRVAAPQLFGEVVLTPLIQRYLDSFPQASILLELVDTDEPLGHRDTDVAISIGAMDDSALTQLRLGTATNWCCASPGYTAAHGEPKAPPDLNAHPLISYARSRRPPVWRLTGPGGANTTIRIKPRLQTNSVTVALESTMSGLGVCHLPAFLVREHVQRGELVRILADWEVRIGPIRAIYRADHLMPPKLSQFLAILKAAFPIPGRGQARVPRRHRTPRASR